MPNLPFSSGPWRRELAVCLLIFLSLLRRGARIGDEGRNQAQILDALFALDARSDIEAEGPHLAHGPRHVVGIKATRKHEGKGSVKPGQERPVEGFAQAP